MRAAYHVLTRGGGEETKRVVGSWQILPPSERFTARGPRSRSVARL